MLIRQVTVQVSPEVTEAFKAKAKANFPKEAFAYLLGHQDNETIQIDDLFYPTGVDDYCHPGYVDVQDKWIRQVRRRAKQTGVMIVGDIHSHPYAIAEIEARRPHHPDTSPSTIDWERTRFGLLMGICLLTETTNGRLRAKIKFWGPLVPVVIKET